MILAGPGFLGYGAKLLWAGAPKAGVDGRAFTIFKCSPATSWCAARTTCR